MYYAFNHKILRRRQKNSLKCFYSNMFKISRKTCIVFSSLNWGKNNDITLNEEKLSIWGSVGVYWDTFSENRISREDQFTFKTDFQWIAPLGHSARNPNQCLLCIA